MSSTSKFGVLTESQSVAQTLKMATSEPNETDEFSAAETVIQFDRPLTLLRGPVRAGPPDDPSSGPYVLAFRDPKAWSNAYKACESRIKEQCEAGSRIGCAIIASRKCKPPWWRFLIGRKATEDLKERAECEEREMEECLAAAKGKCVGMARDKCLKPFGEARVSGMSAKQAVKMVCWVGMVERSRWWSLIGLDCGFGATNYRAGEVALEL